MKFGRYLAENKTPEWARAYMDYRACKKAIKVIAIRLGEAEAAGEISGDDAGEMIAHGELDSSGDEDYGPVAPPKELSVDMGSKSGRGSLPHAKSKSPNASGWGASPGSGGIRKAAGLSSPGYGATSMTTSPRYTNGRSTNPPPLDLGEAENPPSKQMSGLGQSSIVPHKDGPMSPTHSEESKDRTSEDFAEMSEPTRPLTSRAVSRVKGSPKQGKSPKFPTSASPRGLTSPGQIQSPTMGRKSMRSFTMQSPRAIRTARSFEELYETLEPDEKAFFDLLQRELDKVEKFYNAREAEAQRRAHDLRDQLHELAQHRKIFHEMYPNGLPEWEAKVGRIIPVPGGTTTLGGVAKSLRQRIPWMDGSSGDDIVSSGPSADPEVLDEQRKQRLREEIGRDAEHHTYNPERYSKYKKDLRDASLEFYRQLELIKNYRIMNLTGFRKALKKFEKATHIHCMELYSDDKILKDKFAKGASIDSLLQQMEELFTEHFEHGDAKKARDRLRRQQRLKTHYFSVFRTGLCLGFAVPPAVLACVKACETETRNLIPGWQGLLQIYGGFYIAVIFALLFQLNLEAYVAARINYEFVMELSKPSLDYRSYPEIPAFLFLTLSYCFFFTFYRVAPGNVDPSTWPLAWLVFVCVFFLNPLPTLRRRPRYWLLKVLFRVCTPGYSKVDFISFFIADELNSLSYTIQNIYFMGCTYSHHWPSDIYTVCPSGKTWPYALLLALPPLIRLIQCVKRWYDSRLGIHLINAGKYASTILQVCFFVYWKADGKRLNSASFIVWVIVATASAVYASAWDLIVDWSLFRPQSGLLRHDRGYSNRYVYYFAMVSNVLIRFIWVWYIPYPKIHSNTRSFAFAVAEMLRRWQWNFFRVETEHLGNADAYRVTREIPLPYRRIEHDSDDEDKSSDRDRSNSKPNPISVHLDKIRRGIMGSPTGRGVDEANVGPRGHHRQREYEARRPGDDMEEDGDQA